MGGGKAFNLGTLALGLFAYFSIALLALHFVRPDYTLIDHMISDYGVGPQGWIMSTAFLAAGGGCLALALGVFRFGPGSLAARSGGVLLIVAALGLALSAFFPTDLETARPTRTGDVHSVAFLVNIASLLVASGLLAASFGRSPDWRPFQPYAIGFSVLILLALAAQLLIMHRGAPSPIACSWSC
jgi:hypothetical protein